MLPEKRRVAHPYFSRRVRGRPQVRVVDRLADLEEEANGQKPDGRYPCRVCGNGSAYRKPYCSEHISLMPYVRDLIGRVFGNE